MQDIWIDKAMALKCLLINVSQAMPWMHPFSLDSISLFRSPSDPSNNLVAARWGLADVESTCSAGLVEDCPLWTSGVLDLSRDAPGVRKVRKDSFATDHVRCNDAASGSAGLVEDCPQWTSYVPDLSQDAPAMSKLQRDRLAAAHDRRAHGGYGSARLVEDCPQWTSYDPDLSQDAPATSKVQSDASHGETHPMPPKREAALSRL
jgi:hypothetical protein